MHVPDLTDVMKYECVFLSPHLDDIALSCAGRVLEELAAPKKVLIATLFSHPGKADAGRFKADDYPRRREEDRKAAEILGADTLHAGMLDAPFRSETYHTFSGILFKRDSNHATTMMQAADFIARLIERAQPETVFAPLGVGWHIDHRLTREAAMVGVSNFKWRSLDKKNIDALTPEMRAHSDRVAPKLAFYEDRPYSFVAESVRLRLAELGYSADAHDLPLLDSDELRESFIASFMKAQYVKSHMQKEEIELSMRHLNSHITRGSVQHTSQAQSDVHLFDKVTLATVKRVVGEYKSQITALYGDMNGWQQMTRDYTVQLGFDAEYTERFWTLP